jgi:hypothetical protein
MQTYFLLSETMPQWRILTNRLHKTPEESGTHQKVSKYSHNRGKRVIGFAPLITITPRSRTGENAKEVVKKS